MWWLLWAWSGAPGSIHLTFLCDLRLVRAFGVVNVAVTEVSAHSISLDTAVLAFILHPDTTTH